jgi:hypothetical protein
MAKEMSPALEHRRPRSGQPGRDHCLAPTRAVDAPLGETGGGYGRLFPELPPLQADNAALLELGNAGGVCDGATSTTDGAAAAGWPFFGQFIAHDITADRSALASATNAGAIRNFRTPRANLECVYAAGAVGSPYLYQQADPAKLLIGVNDRGERADLPRNAEGIALIGDPRNDVHLFVSQLHLALLKLHNGLVDRLREEGADERVVFDEAARATRWHYQWVVVNEYLPAAAGAEVVEDVLAAGPRVFRPGPDVSIPFEFADGAFRYGHGQIRATYRINESSGELSIFPDLVGLRPVPAERRIDWRLLFDAHGAAAAQRARRIDGTLVGALIHLPHQITGDVDVDAFHSLAARDLERGEALGLPSGEAVARAMGEEPLSADELGLQRSGWSGETPLWLYFMLESAARAGGDRLGPVGGRILVEVLLGLLDADPGSYREVQRDWRPTLSTNGQFTIADLLAFAETAGDPDSGSPGAGGRGRPAPVGARSS